MQLKVGIMLVLATMAFCAPKHKPVKVSILDSLSSSSSSSSPPGGKAAGDLESEGSINLGFGTSGGAIPWGSGYGWGSNCGGYRQQYPSSSYTFGNPYGGFFG